MLYSPILSILRLIILIPWIILITIMHIILCTISRRFFFVCYKILFLGLTKIFGIKVKLTGVSKQKKVLYISNHISYLDIIILGSAVDAIFVAKSEIKKWPFINKLCALGKTIFVERENIKSLKEQTQSLKQNLEVGYNIILFPEGTSSDGSKVLRFKSSLFGLINDEKLKNFYIQPISISYNKLDGLPLVKTHRPFLAWFGAMDFVSHAWQFLGLGVSEVNIKFHKFRQFSDFTDRKQACNYCYEKISQQIIKDFRSLEVDDKMKLNEFKFL